MNVLKTIVKYSLQIIITIHHHHYIDQTKYHSSLQYRLDSKALSNNVLLEMLHTRCKVNLCFLCPGTVVLNWWVADPFWMGHGQLVKKSK